MALSPLHLGEILVGLDGSPDSLAALAIAAVLARRASARLTGLFVEDVELLRTAELPFVEQIHRSSAQRAPVDPAELAVALRQRADRARRALAEAAERAGAPWSFEQHRGRVAGQVLAAAAHADLVVLGWTSREAPSVTGPGRTALRAAREAGRPVLLACGPGREDRSWLVVFDGSEPAWRALLAAAALAPERPEGLVVGVLAPDDREALALHERVAAELGGRPWIERRARTSQTLIDEARRRGAVLVVAAETAELGQLLGGPVLLTR